MKTHSAWTCLALALLLGTGSLVLADVRLPHVIGSNMVLQREKPLPIWGWAEPGEAVTVTLGDQSAKTTTGENGKWKVELPAMTAGGPHKMSVVGKNRIELENILVGEVWVCSGQSNMQWSVGNSYRGGQEIAAAKNSKIRLLTVPPSEKGLPADDMDGVWKTTSPDSVRPFSAVAYFFGKELQAELGVPIGLINTSWGGTRIEPWTPPVGIKGVSGLEDVYGQWEAAQESYARDVDKSLDVIADWLFTARRAAAKGQPFADLPALERPPHPMKSSYLPTSLYNSMIHPLVPFAIRGSIWYQGEANNGEGMLYFLKKKALINGWRKVWGQGDFPFYFVQLAPWYGYPDGNLEGIWEAQSASLAIPNTGMVVTTDLVDNLGDIHPRNKHDVGHRLALSALANTYGRKGLVHSGPLYRSHTVEGNKIRIEFDHVGGGLASRDSKPLDRFQVSDASRFFPAKAKIDGDTVLVWSDEVDKPREVRFGWNKTATPNLSNQEGLPASPFRTDCDPPKLAGRRVFADPMKIYLDAAPAKGTIRYTTDGTAPTKDSAKYEGYVELDKTATVKARFFDENGRRSLVSEKTFTNVPPLEAQGKTFLPGIDYRYYEGPWTSIPDFATLEPIRAGIGEGFAIDVARRADFYAFKFDGFLHVQKAGQYTFYVQSDDGAKLYLDGREIVDNGGLHPRIEKKGEPISLEAGVYPIAVHFLENRGNEYLDVLYEGPGIDKQSLPDSLLYRQR